MQTLHGYTEGGHQLLATSGKLNEPAKRLLVKMSDSPGLDFNRSGETCLSMYPLNDEGKYAIAKTWQAKDQERPGCVWTHTVLIDFNDIPKIEDIWPVISLLKAPTSQNFQEYNKPIEYLSDNYFKPHVVEPLELTELLTSVYSTNSPVISTKFRGYKKAIANIWNQQWPRLRRSFKITTWPNSNNNDSTGFDINFIEHNITDSRISNPYINTAIQWAIKDLIYPENSSLRNFLWKHGGNTPENRMAFIPLTTTWHLMHENKIEEAIEYLRSWKSKPTSIIRDFISRLELIDDTFVIDSLVYLACTEISSLRIKDLNSKIVDKIAESISSRHHDLLNKIDSNAEAADWIISVTLGKMARKDLASIALANPKLRSCIFSDLPKVLQEPSIWANKESAKDAFQHITYDNIRKVIDAIIKSRNHEISEAIIDIYYFDVVEYLIKHKNPNYELISQVISKDRVKFLDILSDSDNISHNLIKIIMDYYPISFSIKHCDTDPWVKIFSSHEIEPTLSEKNYLLQRVLSGASGDPIGLLKLSLPEIATRIMDSSIGWKEWGKMEKFFPSGTFWFVETRSDRFFTAIANFIVINNLPLNEIGDSKDHFIEKIVRRINLTSEGKIYLSGIR
jgi:hypothetical protein